MEIDCDEGMDVSKSVQAQDLDLLVDAVFAGSCGMVRAGSLLEDNQRQKVGINPQVPKQ